MTNTTDSQDSSPRLWVADRIANAGRGRIPKGELVIGDSLVRQRLGCQQVGFQERLAFVSELNLDIFTLSPEYPNQGKRLPQPEECEWPALKEWTTETPLFIFGLLDGAFEWGLRVFGFQEFLVFYRTSPATLTSFIQAVEELNLALIRWLAENGINGIILGDDIAFTQGLMIKPSVLREFFFPSLVRQAALAVRYGLPVFYHSDGNYHDVLPDVINSGFTGIHCIDRTSGMNIRQIQAEVGNALCLWGHLDAADTVRAGDARELAILIDSIRELAQDHRFILGTNSGLFEGLGLEGLRCLYTEIKADSLF